MTYNVFGGTLNPTLLPLLLLYHHECLCMLLQVSKKDAVAELTRPVAGVLLTLMSNLGQTFRAADIAESVVHHADSEQLPQYVSLLDESPSLPTMKSTTSCGGSRSSYASSFQVVLRGLLQHVIGCSQYSFVIALANCYCCYYYYCIIFDIHWTMRYLALGIINKFYLC